MAKLHRSQMTATERAMAREQRASAGVSNRQGGTSYFTQGRGDATPTQEEVELAVQWKRGVEQAGHVSVRLGPRFEDLLPGVPVNTEAAGPSALHVGKRSG